jgi:hypothetical protein
LRSARRVSIGFLRLAMTGQEKIQHAAELDRKRQTAGVVDCCQLKIAFNIIMKTNTTLELTAVRDHVCLKVGVGFGLGPQIYLRKHAAACARSPDCDTAKTVPATRLAIPSYDAADY